MDKIILVLRGNKSHGALYAATTAAVLEEGALGRLQISTIVAAGQQLRSYRFRLRHDGQHYLQPFFNEIVEVLFKELRRGNVLVHCNDLVRSAVVAASFLMNCFNYDYKKATDKLAECFGVLPIPQGFRQQLKTYSGMLKTPLFPAKLKHSFKKTSSVPKMHPVRVEHMLRLSLRGRLFYPSDAVRLPQLLNAYIA